MVRSFSGRWSWTFQILWSWQRPITGRSNTSQDRAAQRLRPVEHRQDRAGDAQPALAQPDDQFGDQGGVLGRALDQ